MITVGLIDDEDKPRSMLHQLITALDNGFEVIGHASSVASGLEFVNKTKPQVLLLDVEMPDGTGFDLVQKLTGHKPHVIFVTAYDHYAVQAFRADAIDYLEKPVNPQYLIDSLNKVAKLIELETAPVYPRHQSLVDQMKEKVAVPTRYGMLYIQTKDILYVKADGAYTEVYMQGSDNPHIVSRRLQQVEASLADLGFVRIHRSYLVNVFKIKQLSKTDGGFVILEDNSQIPFSKHYREHGFHLIKTLTTQL